MYTSQVTGAEEVHIHFCQCLSTSTGHGEYKRKTKATHATTVVGHWFDEDAKAKKRGSFVLRNRWVALNKAEDLQIDEEMAKAKPGDIREPFKAAGM